MRFKAHNIPNRAWAGTMQRKDDSHAVVKNGQVRYLHGKVACGEEFELPPHMRTKPPSWADPVDDEAKAFVERYHREVEEKKAADLEEQRLTREAISSVAEVVKGRRRPARTAAVNT